MRFNINRSNYQLQHNALSYIQQHRLFGILINNPVFRTSPTQPFCPSDSTTRQTIYFVLNREQETAVENIVNGHYRPLPYILYGPPGTGKTKTLVTAIRRIVKTTRKNILVCAQSNAACDEVAHRLSEYLNFKQMLRLYSTSYDVGKIRFSFNFTM